LAERKYEVMAKHGSLFKLLAMLLLGGLAGTIITLLLAPRSGKETRAQLKGKGLQFLHLIKTARQRGGQLHLKRVSNWGNYPKAKVEFYEFEDIDALRELLRRSTNVIPRGNGRCYGDSALAPQIISSLRYNKFLAFDQQKGRIHCQAGVLLADILEVAVPRGWFFLATPGTKLITVGGAIASNVHGKSQHKTGNFCDHVLEMEIMLGDGTIMKCSPTENADLFWTTCGGMGLTGVILNATIQLRPIETAYIRQESIKARNLDEMMDLFEESEEWTYSVAWIDCLAKGQQMGRGYIMRGEHATVADLKQESHKRNPLKIKSSRKLNVPITFPSFALNGWTVKLFNTLIYWRHPQGKVKSIETYDKFFYPLDIIANWNRIYGQRGFTQYQFILPKTASRTGLQEILEKIAQRGMGSFLAVLKLYGEQHGYLPFAMEGYSLALDFPIKDGLFEFLEELDQIVLAYGGRLYLSKDVRMDKVMFMQSYPEVERFIRNVKDLNHGSKFRSFQSDRVGITG
jgi:FAD/FMN-containing dehydrogenase